MAVQLTHTGAQLDAAIGKVQADYADVSGVTASASDVAEGKKFVNSSGVLTTGSLTRAVGMIFQFVAEAVPAESVEFPIAKISIEEE